MVRLTRLRIDRFRNVKPGTELRFGPTFNVLLGKNATGKSTLLDLVAAVTNDDLSAYAKEEAGFDLTWCIEEGEDQIAVRATRTPVKSESLPDRVRDEREFDDVWSIVLRARGTEMGRLDIAGTRGTWKTHGAPPEAFDVRAGLAASRASLRAIFVIHDKYVGIESLRDPETPVATVMRTAVRMMLPSIRGVSRFDEALVALNSIIQSPFQLSREGAAGGGSYGLWLPLVFMSRVNEPTPSDSFVVPFDMLGQLAEIPILLGFASAEVCPRILQRSHDGEKMTTTYQGFDCLFRRADGSQISHELLSFGQKRLFSFLWYLAVRDQLPVVADELLNGLHHEWIEICLDRLRERQSILATQHPFLLDHIPIESAHAVRTTFVRCTTEPGPSGHEQLVWRNFDEEEAERFFIAYQTGIQQVSEVLRSEGLW